MIKDRVFVIGNGESRRDFNLSLLRKNGVLYGCNALYRDFNPDILVSNDDGMIYEIVNNGYPEKHKCIFLNADEQNNIHTEDAYYIFIPYLQDYEKYKIIETKKTEEGSSFFLLGNAGLKRAYVIWLSEKYNIDFIHFDKKYYDWNSGTLSIKIACEKNKPKEVVCIGFDSYAKQSMNHIYPEFYQLKPPVVEQWNEQHELIQNEFPDITFLYEGRDVNFHDLIQ